MRSVWHWCVPQVDELWCAWAHLLEARFAQQGGVKHVFQSPIVQAVLGGVHFVGHRLLSRHALASVLGQATITADVGHHEPETRRLCQSLACRRRACQSRPFAKLP